MEQNKKFNKLSIIAFVLVLIGSLMIFLNILYSSLLFIGFILSRVSSYKINKTSEKGKGLNYASLAIFTIILGLIFIILTINKGYPKGENAAIKSQLSSMKVQAELFS